jgi:hypothetical protein
MSASFQHCNYYCITNLIGIDLEKVGMEVALATLRAGHRLRLVKKDRGSNPAKVYYTQFF